MKKANIFISIALLLGLVPFSAKTFGQTKSVLPFERITLFADRSIYIAGEDVFFSALFSIYEGGDANSLKLSKANENFSEISYIEIVTPEGRSIKSEKYLIDNLKCFGCIRIPDDAATGNYFIRAYTKYMRNFGPYSYCYLPIKIINPFKIDVLPYSSKDTLKANRIKNDCSISTAPITVSIDKTIYSKRDNVVFEIKKDNQIGKTVSNINITVVPEFSLMPSMVSVNEFYKSNRLLFRPELQDITITGKVVDNSTKKAISNSSVNLSVLGDEKDFIRSIADSTGRFFFYLPKMIGVNDLFLSSDNTKNANANFKIDSDFCDSIILLKTKKFDLSENEKAVAFYLAANYHANQLFNKVKKSDKVKKDEVGPFYGKAPFEVVIDQYVLLPTLEDYINELLPLRTTIYQGKKVFKVLNTKTVSLVDPLVLLDFTPVYDISKVLSLPPNKIARIDLVNEPYIKGNITFQGIVSIISKKHDFAGVELPSTGLFLNYKFLEKSVSSYDWKSELDSNKPDTRNTLFWEPNAILDANGEKEYRIQTADSPGKYYVIVRGIYENGEFFSVNTSFEVQ